MDTVKLENPAGSRFRKLACKKRWLGVFQRGVRVDMIAILSPGFDLLSGIV
jgi:hypothetical protein